MNAMSRPWQSAVTRGASSACLDCVPSGQDRLMNITPGEDRGGYGRELDERFNHPPDDPGPDPDRFPMKRPADGTGSAVEQTPVDPDEKDTPQDAS